MQPKPTDAVERPMTLVEKLQAKVDRLKAIGASQDKIETASECLNIAQQHQDESGWIACSERMPEDEQEVLWWNEAYQCLVIGEWRENRELVFYRNGDYADVSEFFYWQCLPKPPSEVQE